jgi:hypothetical protein
MCGPLSRCFWAGTLVVLLLAAVATAQAADRDRPLAPGVLTVITPSINPEETHTGPVPMVDVMASIPDLEWTPNYAPKSQTLGEMAQKVTYRRSIWALEFAFKPLRMIEVDVPQSSNRMHRKLIWYLVYRVRNNGYDLRPTGTEDRWGHTVYQPEEVNIDPLYFFPSFVLRSQEFDKEYLDRVIPAAQRAIQERESPGAKIHNSVEITQVPLPPPKNGEAKGVWGVATWEDIDPRMDFVSVFVGGLTNASEIVPARAQTEGASRLTLENRKKVLQLNFWRPGDSIFEHERELRFGVPIEDDPVAQDAVLRGYGLEERLDYLWVYR